MGSWNPFGVDDEEEEYKKRLYASIDDEARSKIFTPIEGDPYRVAPNNKVYSAMWGEEKSRLLGKKQKLFDIAATGGAQHGGTAVAGGGTSGIGYAPQRDITKTFPGAMSKEEEEYQKMLRARVGPAPGLFRLA